LYELTPEAAATPPIGDSYGPQQRIAIATHLEAYDADDLPVTLCYCETAERFSNADSRQRRSSQQIGDGSEVAVLRRANCRLSHQSILVVRCSGATVWSAATRCLWKRPPDCARVQGFHSADERAHEFPIDLLAECIRIEPTPRQKRRCVVCFVDA